MILIIYFWRDLIKIYDQAVPERKIEIKQKNPSSPWISSFKKIVKKKTVSI